jgi:hypothetical protein
LEAIEDEADEYCSIFNNQMDHNKELEVARADFSGLVQEGILPPKMEAKLAYLEAAIAGRPVESRLIEGLPEF